MRVLLKTKCISFNAHSLCECVRFHFGKHFPGVFCSSSARSVFGRVYRLTSGGITIFTSTQRAPSEQGDVERRKRNSWSWFTPRYAIMLFTETVRSKFKKNIKTVLHITAMGPRVSRRRSLFVYRVSPADAGRSRVLLHMCDMLSNRSMIAKTNWCERANKTARWSDEKKGRLCH